MHLALSLLLSSLCIVLGSATLDLDCSTLSNSPLVRLKRPEIEQIQWGMDGQGVRVRYTNCVYCTAANFNIHHMNPEILPMYCKGTYSFQREHRVL